MKRFAVVVISGITLLVAPADASAPIALPGLTKAASHLSGLPVSRRVRVVMKSAPGMRQEATRILDRDYPADQQAYDETLYRALGLLAPTEPLRPVLLATQTQNVVGVYDPLRRVLYLRAGKAARRAVVHELVRALQDQAFDLRRLSALRRRSRDAAAAAAAAVEGDATFATDVLGRRVLAASPRPIETFLRLEHDFPYANGVRFVATLYNLGGNRAVFTSLRAFPQTTKQVFHVDAFLTREQPESVALPASGGGFSLVSSDTFGELDVRALLVTFHVPGLGRAADGWTGGRTGLYRDAGGATAVALDLSWASELDAAQWGEAVRVYVNEAFDADSPGFPATVSCTATACWSLGGRGIAYRRVGAHTALVFAQSVAAAAALAGSLDLK